MWEEDKKSKLGKLILAGISLLLIIVLIVAVLAVRKKEAAQDAQLLELYQQQQAQQQQARQETVDEVMAGYEQDLACIQEYMPGIVCWGDVLTGGSTGGVSYPSALQELINTRICDVYDYRGTIKNADELNNRIEWDEMKVGIPVVNMGTGEENVNTILGRCGAVPYVVAEPFEIPAGRDSVAIKFRSANGGDVAPLTYGDAGINDITIVGVKGKLSIDAANSRFSYFSTSNYITYLFTRNEAGAPVAVEPDTEIITAASGEYLDYVPIIFVGSFGGYDSSADLVAKIQAIIDRQTRNDRYLVIGTYYYQPYYLSSGTRGGADEMAELESTMQKAFGDHYINLRKYLASDAMADAGLKPTSSDSMNMSVGIVPSSLLNQENHVELTPAAYQLVGNIVYERMAKLGYFNEIVEELEIENFGRDVKQ